MSKEAGGQAFPTPATEWHGNDEGMTLRDYFAAKVMQEMVSIQQGHNPTSASYQAYAWADAMLKARNEQ